MNEREIQTRLKKLWGATGMPFGATTRSDYQSALQNQLREEWLRWIELGANGVIAGEHGVGKTVMLQKVKEGLSPKLYTVVTLTHTSLSAGDVLCALCQTLGVEPSFRRSKTARTLVEIWQREGRKPVLLVDEAQNLTAAALEELRLLMCASGQLSGSHPRESLSMSLCGDRQLLPKLKLGINAPLLSRLGYQLQLEGLIEDEVEAYLQARFEEVGIPTPPLETGTIPLIHKASEGNPRKINQLLQQAILLLLEAGSNRVDSALLQKAMGKVPSLQVRRNAPASSA
jgi:type II secretory pathway predicted ATPase ExeA